ncbi:MAG: hypothetical protein IKO30_08270 [Lachnospiraceae bacterium]|nr:hypothetical protein [Lachnospiraceae bacterium]
MKKNNIKMTKNARIGIATMAAIMAMSLAAPLAANAASLRGYENRAAAGTEDNNDDGSDDDHGINTTDVTKWTISIIKGDDKMKTLLEASEKAVHGIVYKIPQIGYVAGPMFEMLKVLCESDEPETTLGSISKQLEGIQEQIEDAKAAIIEAMGTMSDMDKFVDQYNLFNAKYKEVSKQVSHISGFDMSQETKNSRLAKMVGEVSDWYSDDNLIFNQIALGSFLSGETKLVSGKKDIYEAIMDHYSKIVLFGKEAMDKTEDLTADALAVYLESSTQLINCIIAKRNDLLADGSENSLCDADYCKTKISEMLNQIIKVNETLDAYIKNNDPLTFYDRTGNGQKNIILSESVAKADFNKKKSMNDLVGSKALSDKQLKSIVDYVKKNYPGKSVLEYLTYVGFTFSDKTYEAYLKEYEKERADAEKALKEAEELLERKANEPQDQQIVIFPDIPGVFFFDPIVPTVIEDWEKKNAENTVKEMTEFLKKSPMTKEEYQKSCKVSEGAFFLTSRGRKNSTTMSSGTAADYYYKGVRLQDTTYTEKENHYLYISESYKTTKRNEAKADLYYLVAI